MKHSVRHLLHTCLSAANQDTTYLTTHARKRISVDLLDHSLSHGGTIPPEIFVTSKASDLVIADDAYKAIEFLEVTCYVDKDELVKDVTVQVHSRRHGITEDEGVPFSCKEEPTMEKIRVTLVRPYNTVLGQAAARATFSLKPNWPHGLRNISLIGAALIRECVSPLLFEKHTANGKKE